MRKTTAKATRPLDLHVRIDKARKDKLDALRRKEPDMPPGSEMIRRLIDRAK